jgi:hypothetical protein
MSLRVHQATNGYIQSARQVLMRLASARQVTGNFILVCCDGENWLGGCMEVTSSEDVEVFGCGTTISEGIAAPIFIVPLPSAR